MLFNKNSAAKACVAAVFLAALVTATSASGVATESAATAATAATPNAFAQLLKRFLFGGAAATTTDDASTTDAPTTTPTTTPLRAAATALNLAASAKALGVSEASLTARGLAPELPPHNITHEPRDRRELGQLDGWMDGVCVSDHVRLACTCFRALTHTTRTHSRAAVFSCMGGGQNQNSQTTSHAPLLQLEPTPTLSNSARHVVRRAQRPRPRRHVHLHRQLRLRDYFQPLHLRLARGEGLG
jgi:hypothetical protein